MKLEKPLLIFWDITNRCNLDCNFCMWNWDYAKNIREASRLKKEEILNEIKLIKPLKVVLTGGEPLLTQGIFHYIYDLKKEDIFVELTTNGTLLNDYTVSNLKDACVDKLQVSILGSTRELNNRIMGGEAFDLILTGLENLAKHGIRFKTKTTVTSENIDDIENLAVLLKDIGAESVNFSEFIPMGAAYLKSELTIPTSKLKYWKERLGQKFDKTVEFSSTTLDIKELGHPRKCSLGADNSYLAQILWDGNVIQCALSTVFPFSNSIFNSGLKKAWENLSQLKRFNPEIENKTCSACRYLKECNGGCRALAYINFNSIHNPDPRCPEKKQKSRKKVRI
ncbi:MAG TPA: radical SAM protein [Firmicutes bacterium]|nr:radical SAM protein [Bacillota bacterium]